MTPIFKEALFFLTTLKRTRERKLVMKLNKEVEVERSGTDEPTRANARRCVIKRLDVCSSVARPAEQEVNSLSDRTSSKRTVKNFDIGIAV